MEAAQCSLLGLLTLPHSEITGRHVCTSGCLEKMTPFFSFLSWTLLILTVESHVYQFTLDNSFGF